MKLQKSNPYKYTLGKVNVLQNIYIVFSPLITEYLYSARIYNNIQFFLEFLYCWRH